MAASADVSQTGVVFYEVPGQISQVGTVDGTKTTTGPVYTTNDVVWT